MTLYVLRYNNYYNRRVLTEPDIGSYLNRAAYYTSINNVNFIPNDNINTTQIINSDEIYNEGVDYAILYDGLQGKIISRWFILETVRQRAGQYLLKLYRDIVGDYYTEVLRAPAFIEKATLPRNNPFIFNREAMAFNQIKTAEYLLKDATRVPWIVGYVARNRANAVSIEVPTQTLTYNYDYDSFSDYAYYQYATTPLRAHIRDTVYIIKTQNPALLYAGGNKYNFCWGFTGARKNPLDYSGTLISTGVNQYVADYDGTFYLWYSDSITPTEIMLDLEASAKVVSSDWSAYGLGAIANTASDSQLQNLLNENGKIIKVGEQAFKIRVARVTDDTDNIEQFTVPYSSSLGIAMADVIADNQNLFNLEYLTTTGFLLQGRVDQYEIYFDPTDGTSATITIPTDTVSLVDAPYDMFAIPYIPAGGIFYFRDDTGTYRVSRADTLRMVQYLQVNLGSLLYDLQLLPYCPIMDYISYSSTYNEFLDVSGADQKRFQKLGDKAIMIWCDNSSFEAEISPYRNFHNKYIFPDNPEDATEFKVEHECDFYRIVSPNYNGTFEIKKTSNDGLKYFTASCAYKPYRPYIKVAPEFGGLYGQTFDDARGLVVGGDFSLPAITDQWIEYQILNKNYQDIFDRQIENLEFHQGLQRLQQGINATVGVASAAGTGAMFGAQVGGGYGAIAGAAIGGVSSLAGGIADAGILAKQQAETLDYTRDLFGYNLGNIQARPQSLTKVSAFNPDNKIFPFIEYYTCTDEEKQALRDKLKYNGMTVMAIGTVGDYQQLTPTYIKARLIRFEGINADYHEAVTLAEEINKGVFI